MLSSVGKRVVSYSTRAVLGCTVLEYSYIDHLSTVLQYTSSDTSIKLGSIIALIYLAVDTDPHLLTLPHLYRCWADFAGPV